MSKKTNEDLFALGFVAGVVGVTTLPFLKTIHEERAKRKQIRLDTQATIADIRYARDIVLQKIAKGDYDTTQNMDEVFSDFEFYRLTHRLDQE